MAKLRESLIFKLLLGVFVGLILGYSLDAKIGVNQGTAENIIGVINTVKFILGQVINFTIPLIILGFIAPAITKMKANASKMLGTMLMMAYLSSVGAALLSMTAGYMIIPKLNIAAKSDIVKNVIPKLIFKVEIPPVFSVMTALVLALFLGLAVVWTESKTFEKLLDELNDIMLKIVYKIIIPILPFFIASTFTTLAYEGEIIKQFPVFEKLLDELNDIMLKIVYKIIIPILPFFIASTFTTLAYEGEIIKQFPVFLKVIIIVLVGHFIWLTVLYTLGGAISGKNPLKLLKSYGPAYLTAVGTMSSAATLPVALSCAKKSGALDEDIADFAIPLGSTIHLCGSVLTEVFFVMTVSKMFSLL